MTDIVLHITNPEALDPRTMAARYDHLVMSRWLGYCQAWRWDGGDAIVVTVGTGRNVSSWASIRCGTIVSCVDISRTGVAGYLREHGFQVSVA